MSRSIYDMFNDRKEGIDVLYEGAEFEDVEVEAYESLEVAINELETIVKESTNEFIEFQAAAYLEDLVLENMMYEYFDEEKISSTMEATMGERLDGMVAKIKKQWEKIRNWFVATMKSIANYFVSGEKLVSTNSGKIPAAMKKCTAKVKMYDYEDPNKALDKCYVLVNKAKDRGATSSKEGVLRAVGGAKDRADVARVVKEVFGIKDEPTEKQIADINPGLAMEYAGNKKAFIDAINKLKGQVDQDFKAVLAVIEKGEDKEAVGKQVEVFNFATSIKTAIINAEIACVKKASGDMLAVVRKALASTGGVAGAAEQKRKEKASNAQAKSFEREAERQNGYEIESFKANLESMMEDLEFVDDEE